MKDEIREEFITIVSFERYWVWCDVGWSRWKLDERQKQSQQFYACKVPSEKKSLDWSGQDS